MTMMTTTTRILSPTSISNNNEEEEIQQEWNVIFIVFAYSLSFVASYTAVHLLDHTLWRKDEEEYKIQIIKHPRLLCSIILGFGAVWSMHFVGMAAVTLKHDNDDNGSTSTTTMIQQCYNWPITIGSMIAAISCIFLGLKVASYDIFAGPDRLDNLKLTLLKKRDVTHKKRSAVAIRTIQRTVLFHKIHHIVAGGIIAAMGAIVMHYTGMMAIKGPFRMEFDTVYVILSVFLAVLIHIIGFWILLRLRWKAKQFWLRYVSAAVLAFGVSSLHFFGMLSVTYIADDTLEGRCNESFRNSHNNLPGHWTTHQQIVIAVSLAVPLIAAIVENLINQELLLAYRIKADPDFSKFLTSDRPQLSHNNSSLRQGKVRITGLYGCNPHDNDDEEEASITEQEGTTTQPLPSPHQPPLPSKKIMITELDIRDMKDECHPPIHNKKEEFSSLEGSSNSCGEGEQDNSMLI